MHEKALENRAHLKLSDRENCHKKVISYITNPKILFCFGELGRGYMESWRVSGCCGVAECSLVCDMWHCDIPAAHAVWHFPAGCTRRRPCSDVLHFHPLPLSPSSLPVCRRSTVHSFCHLPKLAFGSFCHFGRSHFCYVHISNVIKQELKFPGSEYKPWSLVVVCLTSGNGFIAAGSAKLEREERVRGTDHVTTSVPAQSAVLGPNSQENKM